MWPFTRTPAQLLELAEYHRAKAETYEEQIAAHSTHPASWVSQAAVDRGLEAKYRQMAVPAQKGGEL